MSTRGAFLVGLTAAALMPAVGRAEPAPFVPWHRGMLDVHHLSSARGNTTFITFPDGSTLVIDAGDPGPATAAYIGRRMRALDESTLDTIVLTHFHPDHANGLGPLIERFPVRQLIDRGAPTYDVPPPPAEPGSIVDAYRAMIAANRANIGRVERFIPGSSTQIGFRVRTGAFSDAYSVRNLAVNGIVWTASGDRTRALFPPLETLARGAYPTENMCSAALRLTYGDFRYYAGGDLTYADNGGLDPWRDVETPVARACGRVDVAAVDHHGYFDAGGPNFVRALQPRAFVVQAWHITHPAISTLDTMLNRRLYPGDRDIFVTRSTPENLALTDRFAKGRTSNNGHVVVRVEPGGARYRVEVIDPQSDDDRVLATFGPYVSTKKDTA